MAGPPGGEVLVAVSNKNLITEDGKYGILETFCSSVKRAGVRNFLVVALVGGGRGAPAPGTEPFRGGLTD